LNANGVTLDNIPTLTETDTDSFGEVSTTTASASYVSLTDNSVSASGSSVPGTTAELTPVFFTQGSATLSFWVEVVQNGGAPQTFLPVEILASFETNATAGSGPCAFAEPCAEASANINVSDVYSTGICSQDSLVTLGCFGGEGSGALPPNFTFNATVGEPFIISMSVSGLAGFGGSWSASVDPTIEIDPNLADAADFTLEATPSPFAATPTPEPSTLPLLGAGLLGLLGAGMYKRLHKKPCGAGLPPKLSVPFR
jgi:hypothetical protein